MMCLFTIEIQRSKSFGMCFRQNKTRLLLFVCEKVSKKVTELDEYIQLAQMEEDESLYEEIQNELKSVEEFVEDAEFKNMLSGRDDDKNCLLTRAISRLPAHACAFHLTHTKR